MTNTALNDLKSELIEAVRRDQARQRAKRKALRATALSLAAATVLSGTAFAATKALGVINLGGGISAAQVSSLPEWDGLRGTFTTGGSGVPYIYHVTGGNDPILQCGPSDPHPTNNIYITATRPLATAELKALVAEELGHETLAAEMLKQVAKRGELPLGARWVKRGQHPEISSTSGAASTPSQAPPPGVLSISNGCPTPGVAGQPGIEGSAPEPGKEGVAVAPQSNAE